MFGMPRLAEVLHDKNDVPLETFAKVHTRSRGKFRARRAAGGRT